jgi:RHS repeat-associated protein
MDTIYDHDSKVWTDWIYVRKCIENEPTYSISNLSTGNDYGYTSDATAGNVYFTYDSLGRKIAMNDPDMGNWTYEYDLNGNLINQTDARGISTLLSYDALDRLTAIDYPNDDDVSFTYDLQYNGTLSQVTRGNVSSSYDYDQRYRVENETVTLDGTGYTTSYEYDSMDRPTTITYPDGNSVNLTYNAQTLLESVEGVVDNLDYNARNQITTKELSNGVVTSYTYDAEKLLLDRIYTESLQDLNYDFDNVGNILEIEDNVLNSVKTYGYDDLDRLTSADMSVNSVSTYQRDFIYDQYGCIQQVNENDVTISSYEYNLTPFHAPDTYNGNILDYDANGNLVEDEDFTYTYNDANQLSEVHYAGNSSLVEKYWYDANGQRVKKQNYAGEFTYYVNQFYEIENGTATSYFFRDDERIAKETSGDMEWYLSDHLGSTTLLINESGLEVERTEYYPYGEVQSGGLEKYGFTGQENDADTELMYYGARYYSPQYRIFVQPDTMLPDPYNPQALNRYAYTLNNPMKYTDPTGHYVESGIDIAFIAMDLNDIRTGNADKWTYIGLATDVVCLALPGATGGRLAVTAVEEGVTHADNVGDLFKFLDKTLEAEVNINRVDNVNDAFKTLDWGSYVRKGEKREEHVMLHATDNLDKSLHGIFNGDPIQMTNDAWANKGNIEPILDRGDDVYYIPYENAGIEGGARGSGETLNYIKVVTVTGTNKIITAYPSKLPE